jgi:hypothetical protein
MRVLDGYGEDSDRGRLRRDELRVEPFSCEPLVCANLFSESVSGFLLAAFARVEALGN